MKQPAPVYQKIAGHQWRHIWLSGDIHGCLEQLRRKLWHCRFDPWRDLLISVGDVIDRGPQSLRCLQLLEQHWVRAVRGNHEQMAMDALASQQMSLWLMNGGDWFIALADNQQKQAKTALENVSICPLFLKYTVVPANMLLLMPIIQMMFMNGKRTLICIRSCGAARD